jgi:N-methylhydantoinase A
MPGPACYGQGGVAATVTDANVVLGYLDATAFMGGKRPLDVRAAEAAIDHLAVALKITRDEAAFGIFRLVNLKMADGIRLMTLRRGVDPRRFALLSFGGAAGLHAAEVARELELTRIIVPTTASVLSAWGMLTSDLRYEVSRTHFETGAHSTASEVRGIFAELEQRAVERLRGWFDGPITVERSAEMRYGEQIFEIDVPLEGIDLDAPTLIADIEDRFHVRHEELYTYASRDQEVVFVNARVAAIGAVAGGEVGVSGAPAAAPCKPRGRRKAFFGAWREVDIYGLDDLRPGHAIAGPAIIEAETTTVVINDGDRLTVNALGWLDIEISKARGG